LARLYGGTLGLIAFLAIVMRGLLSGSLASATLFTASISLPLFFIIGCVIGWFADQIVWESVRAKIESNINPDQEVASDQPATSGP
jgi:hypothetical protein